MNAGAPLDAFVPEPLRRLADPARDLPRLAKDRAAMAKIAAAVAQVPTRHRLLLGDARHAALEPGSVHLVLTSPPYWTLKEYRRSAGQLGWIADYDEFLDQLDEVWRWTDIAGASTRDHPAPYPVALADRLIRMFSFVGDTVLDPFTGTASTQVAAASCGRNTLGIEVDPVYFEMAVKRLRNEAASLLSTTEVSCGEIATIHGLPATA